ncbi:MAG: FliM/FliN family flagellar motor switch protein [Myxococcaceae bacterium]|nr:FliM/FliN family flagellar motor switch protein [Myxococcaceae bacterium]
MSTQATVTTTVSGAPKEPRTSRISLVSRVQARKLTRAHVLVERRPELSKALQAAATAASRAVGAGLATELQLGATLLDSVVNPFGALSRHATFALLDLGPLAARAVVELDLRSTGLLLGHVAGARSSSGPLTALTRIEEAALGWLFLEAIAAVREVPVGTLLGARLLSVHTQRDEVVGQLDCRQRHLAIELIVGIGQEAGHARVLVPAAAVQRLGLQFPEQGPGTLDEGVAKATIAARLRAGSAVLATSELRVLRAGDVVVLDGLQLSANGARGAARLTTGSFELTGALDAAGFTVRTATTTAFTSKERMMNDATHLPPLPVELEVELARLRLPVSELATLKAGALIPLRIGANDPVVLRIGDRAVARAELVDIDGEVGARILGMLP